MTQVAEEGLERPHVSDCKTNDLQHAPNSFGTESGTLQDETGTVDPDLAVVVEAWPNLPEAVQADILAMARAAGGDAAGAVPSRGHKTTSVDTKRAQSLIGQSRVQS